ncbi:ribosomal RNA small subunit methyltransferase A [Candidatus Nomurabacteria bacterium]|nr:MAG: ribosomal RNA small subunit methyltransferase A [Candidatus Nomurabacteria bacterium]
MKHIAKKSLGQNFLNSPGAISKMVSAAGAREKDIVLEIGPGKGVLTRALLNTAGKVVAIEKDYELAAFLHEEFKKEIDEGRLEIIEGDALDFDPQKMSFYKNFEYKLIANIPYNITGAIFEKFLSAKYQPSVLVLLIQDEVAKRIVAKSSKESILSISIKAYGDPVYIQKVVRGSFFPIPGVDSAILAVNNISRNNFEDLEHETVFFSLLKIGFSHKRKKLAGNLRDYSKDIEWRTILSSIGVDSEIRAEDLDLKDWILLGKTILDINRS